MQPLSRVASAQALSPSLLRLSTVGGWAIGMSLGGGLLMASDDSVRIEDFSLAAVHPVMTEATVQVNGFNLVPMAYHEGLIQLHPKLMLGAAYDSNIFADRTDVRHDEYFEALAGVEGEAEISENQRFYTDSVVEGRLYAKNYNRQQLLARLYAQYEQDFSNASQMLLTGTYNRTDDPLIQTGFEVDHGELLGGAQYSYEGLASRYILRVDYENSRFYQGDAFFAPHERDYDIYRATGLYGFRKGEASEFIVRVSADEFHYLQENPYQSGTGLSGIVGWRGLVVPKISAVIGGGLEVRHFDHSFAQDPNFKDKQVVRPVGIMNVKYDLEEGSFVALRTYSQIEPSEVSNAVWYYGLGVSFRYRLLVNEALIGGVEYYHGRESGTPVGLPLEQRDTGSSNLGVEYYLREGVGMRLIAQYDDSHSKDYNSFTRLTVRAEMAFAY